MRGQDEPPHVSPKTSCQIHQEISPCRFYTDPPGQSSVVPSQICQLRPNEQCLRYCRALAMSEATYPGLNVRNGCRVRYGRAFQPMAYLVRGIREHWGPKISAELVGCFSWTAGWEHEERWLQKRRNRGDRSIAFSLLKCPTTKYSAFHQMAQSARGVTR